MSAEGCTIVTVHSSRNIGNLLCVWCRLTTKLESKHMQNSELCHFKGIYVLWRDIGHAKRQTVIEAAHFSQSGA